jgi:hypothetical protein
LVAPLSSARYSSMCDTKSGCEQHNLSQQF